MNAVDLPARIIDIMLSEGVEAWEFVDALYEAKRRIVHLVEPAARPS